MSATLWAEYERAVRYAASILHDEDDARDVVVNVIATLIDTGVEEVSHLMQMTRHRAIDRKRKARVTVIAGDVEFMDGGTPTPEVLTSTRQQMRQLLEVATADERLLTGCDYVGYDTHETAALMGKTEEAVRKIRQRVRQKARNIGIGGA